MLYPAEYTKPLSENFTSALTQEDIERVNKFYMLPGQSLDEWQVWLMRSVLETYPKDHPDKRKAGKLRYRAGVLIEVPRQVGKTTVLGALMWLGYLKSAKKRNVTKLGCVASSVQQAQILFERVTLPFNQVEALSKRHSVNRQQRTLRPKDNSILAELKAYATVQPTKLQSIPFSADAGIAVVVDEVHLLAKEVYSSMKLGLQAQPDSILVGITSAGDETSLLLHELEAIGIEAVQGLHERFGYFKYYAPEHLDYPLRSKEMIEAANPAVECGRFSYEQVLEESSSIPDHEYSRYILGRHGQADNLYLNASLWAKSTGNGIPAHLRNGAVFAIDRTEHWEYASIVAAAVEDGVVYTELVAQVKNAGGKMSMNQKLLLICKKLFKSYRGIFVMDAATLSELRTELKEKQHYPIQFYNKQQLAQATSFTYAAAANDQLSHKNDPIMQNQRKVAMTVATGDGYAISVKDSMGDIDSLKAMTLAVHWADTRNKQKLQTISY